MGSRPHIRFQPEALKYVQSSICNPQAIDKFGAEVCEARFARLLQRLTSPPLYTTLRINTRQHSREQIKELFHQVLVEQYGTCDGSPPKLSNHAVLPDTLIVSNTGPHHRQLEEQEVIVGVACGMSVLRGADVFAQGIMGAPNSMRKGDKVSVYADIKGHCCKGFTKVFEGEKLFVGNGIAQLSRQELFCADNNVTGVGIQMKEPLYSAPSLSGVLPEFVFPQNLPSIVCGHVLNPQPGERILDMCASPGGKTTHIASLMDDQGVVIALDKSAGKVARIQANANAWHLKSIHSYVFDSTKSVDETADVEGGPPYPPECFNRVLLDTPCSALGQRPSVINKLSIKEMKSYPPLQRKLFDKAVQLLRPGGVLVYSTCTLPLEENEGQVEWALKTFPCLQLVPQEPHLGGPGMPGSGLSQKQLEMVQRFGPCIANEELETDGPDTDTIGFFCCKFVKCNT